MTRPYDSPTRIIGSNAPYFEPKVVVPISDALLSRLFFVFLLDDHHTDTPDRLNSWLCWFASLVILVFPVSTGFLPIFLTNLTKITK